MRERDRERSVDEEKEQSTDRDKKGREDERGVNGGGRDRGRSVDAP